MQAAVCERDEVCPYEMSVTEDGHLNDALDELREALDEEDDDAEGEIESGVIPARESESERRGVF